MGSKFAVLSSLLVAFLGGGQGSCQNNAGAGQASADTTKADITLPGVDTSVLTPRERKEWSGYVTKFAPPCQGAGASIAACLNEKKTCDGCMPAAKYLVKAVRDGMTDEQVERAYRNRFEASRLKDVKIDDSPSKGSLNAPITIVEFADFECPHCAGMAPLLKKIFTERGYVRSVYKFMPLPGHPNGEIAARAGIAAAKQGKFWEMHDKMFQNSGRNSLLDLEGYAKEVGLDMTRFKADLNSAETTDRITRDKKLAEALDVKGTPTIYINGRLFEGGANGEQSLYDWIDLEMRMKGLDPKAQGAAPVASGSASAAPTAAPTASSTAGVAPKQK